MDLGLTILVAKQIKTLNLNGFLEPFEWSTWAAVIGAFIFVGVCLTMCSYCSPYEHRGLYSQRENRADQTGRETRNQLSLGHSWWLNYASWMQQVRNRSKDDGMNYSTGFTKTK
jgi:hypothetical protein